jgi:hypothetical protein
LNGNPWRFLPPGPDYVLPDDEADVRAFNGRIDVAHKHFLHIDKILPEPFVGAKDAPVLLLSNNPGFGEGEAHRRDPEFMDQMRKNLRHEPADYPFVYLDPRFGAAEKWWARKLKWLLAPCGPFSPEVVARSILNVVFFPYPSCRYGHDRVRLRSQAYGFDLVREAMRRDAVIVSMRKLETKKPRWLMAVPKLKGYSRFYQVRNVRNPVIGPPSWSGFADVFRAIKVVEARR